MPLTAGTKLGRYEIVALIGKGGMGEVYRARDPQLNREVAVKVSHEQFGERFQREARVVASLNHPNICHLYDVGPDYLVMELVEGPTLAERMEERPLIEAEAINIASQIADALGAAHEKGIVHRDLKPGNVKIRADGTVKVLDFGLAKVGAAPAAQVSEDSPTVSIAATQAGVVLGTAAYMSPEQAKGEPVDKRADIWSFGVVVYEMLAGRRLFKGEGLTDTLAAVIEREPDWSKAPPKARPLLRRCLMKDPKKRLHDIADAMPLIDLVPEAAGPAGGRTSRVMPWMVAVAVLAAGVATFLYLRERASAVPPEQVRFRMALPENQKLGNFTLSPDGRQLAFIATGADAVSRLWVRRLDSLEARFLLDTEGVSGKPFWSPDGRQIVFAADQKLKKIDPSGGPPQTICGLPGVSNGGAWNADNVILIGTGQGVLRVSAKGGTPSLAADQLMGNGLGVPTFLADGRHFLYFMGAAVVAERGVWVGSLEAKPQEQPKNRLIATPSTFAYVPSDTGKGRVFFLRDGSLVTQVFDENKLQLDGEAVPLVDRVANDSGYGLFTVSQSGALIYLPGAGSDVSLLTWYSRDGKPLGTAGEAGTYGNALLSPDGKSVAVTQAGDVWIVDLTRNSNTRLTTSGKVLSLSAVWSPDGKHVAYTANPGGIAGIYQAGVNGADPEVLLWKTELTGYLGPSHWSPDGHFLLFGAASAKTSLDVWALPLLPPIGDRKPFPVLQSQFAESGARFSPDGKWVAYLSNKSGTNEIYVRPFDPDRKDDPAQSGWERLVSRGGASSMLQWKSDQKELYYLGRDGKITAVPVSTGADFHVGEPTGLFPMPSPGFLRVNAPAYLADVKPDGKQFLLAVPVAHSAANDGLTVVLNWQVSLAK